MGMIENGPTAAQTAWRVVGTEADKDYVIEVDVYVPVVSSADPPDNFLYQMVLFGVSGAGYGRMHFQYNTGSTTDPRIRVQTAYPSFVTPYAANIADITGLDATEGWKNVRVEVDNTASTVHVTVDSVELNNGDPIAITQTGFADGGRAGMGMYINGDTVNATNGLNGPRQLYFDNFSVSALSTVDDWATYH